MIRIARHLLADLLKNKIIIGSFALFALTGWGLFFIESQPEKALLILMQVTLLAIPLLTLVFGSIYYYNSEEFIELILSHPVKRGSVIQSFHISLSAAFSLAFLLGIGLPILVFHPGLHAFVLLAVGVLLVWAFIGIALFISTLIRDRVRGMGLTLIVWAFFAFLFDGLLIYLMYSFADYPIEKLILVLTFLNPVDIGRIAVIMQTEAAAMMGLSGAVFRDFFGSAFGLFASFAGLVLWVVLMYFLALRNFRRQDL